MARPRTRPIHHEDEQPARANTTTDQPAPAIADCTCWRSMWNCPAKTARRAAVRARDREAYWASPCKTLSERYVHADGHWKADVLYNWEV